MNKKIIVLFDLDGTLVDSTPAILESFLYAYKKHNNTPPNKQNIIQCIGHTLDSMFEQNGVKKDEIKSYVNSYRECYRSLMEKGTKLLPQAREAILKAYIFANIGVVTTKRGDFSAKLLENFGLLSYFSVVIGIEQVSRPKPDSEPILKAIERINVNIPNDRIFMIGDTILDLQAAKNAGINGIGVLCGYGSKQSLQSFNTPLFNNALEAVDFIESNF